MDKMTYIQLDRMEQTIDRLEAKINALLEVNGIKIDGEKDDPVSKN